MNAGQLAALIAASFFAIGVSVGVYVLLRFARLITQASTVLTGYSDATQALIDRAEAAVDRADEQLARTGALTEGVEAVSASMSDLSDQVSAVAGSARMIANGLGAPVLRFAAASYGVRRALAIRRPGRSDGAERRGRIKELPSRDRVRS
jgi:ABC-type transporter Mla subunit MlaD